MANEFDYYLIQSAGNANVPLLECDDDVDEDALDFLAFHKQAEIKEPVYLCFNEETTKRLKKPQMVDFHTLPYSVFSQKIHDVLAPMNIEDLQLVSAIVNGKEGAVYKNYWIVNACNQINCFDKEKSTYPFDDDDEDMDLDEMLADEGPQKVFLDKEALAKIPLDKRLVIVSKEDSRFELYHKSVVDKIMAVKPIGVTFTPIEEWYEGIQFKV